MNGVLFHQMLHGVDIQPPSSRFSKSIGHQHVLEPDLRTKKGAHDFAQHLLTKAAERLRRGDYYCRRLGVHLSWVADLGGWWDEITFQETHDTGFRTRLFADFNKSFTDGSLFRVRKAGIGGSIRQIAIRADRNRHYFTADDL
jgi:impB/mucB/samB family protein